MGERAEAENFILAASLKLSKVVMNIERTAAVAAWLSAAIFNAAG